MTTPERSGRDWAYVGVVLGAAVSIAANVAHSYVPPPGSPPGWAPHPGAVASAVCWPVLLFVGVEVVARVWWPPGGWWLLVRWGGLGSVALLAAVVSWRHLSGLLAWYGEDALTATLGPLAVDGMMVMAAAALLADRRRRAAPVPPVEGSPVPAETVDTHAAGIGPDERRTGTRTGSGKRTDDDLKAILARMPRDDDGTISVRRAAKTLGTGPGRARRLLADAGLLRGPALTAVPPTPDGSDLR